MLKETLSAGAYTQSTRHRPIFPMTAVDASGNVYIADSGNDRVLKLDYVTPPSLSFASRNTT